MFSTRAMAQREINREIRIFFMEIFGDELIREYFYKSYTNLEISVLLLLRHNISISGRQIRRILEGKGLMRRGINDQHTINAAIQDEISGSGRCLGYRSMTQRLLSKHGLRVPRDKVYECMKVLDPEGIQLRKRHRLSRRVYSNKGPNFLIHIDGYDKLKRYGFALHGAICGFSRRILWLRVGRTNNDPRVVASYFLDYLLEIRGVPRCIRADRGTENTVIECMQQALRWYHQDDMAGEKSFLYGKSPSNQRIERWWLSARQGGIQFWIDFFKDLEDTGEISTENDLKKECLRFAFTNVIQQDLNRMVQDWNQHRIRCSTNAESPAGKPDILFYTPEVYDTYNYSTDVPRNELEAFSEVCLYPGRNGCEQQFESYCKNLMEENGRIMPYDHTEAFDMYKWLCSQVQENVHL